MSFLAISAALTQTVIQAPYNAKTSSVEEAAIKKAYSIWKYLSKFPFKDNDTHSLPETIEERGDLDCDDHAFASWIKLTKSGIPAKLIIILDPQKEGQDHAICIYKAGNKWCWMDNVEFSKDKYDNWQKIPARISNRPVYFVEVDVNNTWYKGEPDPRINNNKYWILSK